MQKDYKNKRLTTAEDYQGPRTTDQELGDDAVRDGLADGLGLGMHVQFLVDATNVVADSVNAHTEVIGSGLIAIALGQHPEKRDLVRRKIMGDFPGWRGLLEELHNFACHFR